jgi:hypothetical protein
MPTSAGAELASGCRSSSTDRKDIRSCSDGLHPGIGTRLDIALAAVLALLGGSLCLYLSHAVVALL